MKKGILWYSNKKVKMKLFSRVRLFATLWTVAHEAPLSMGFSRQEYWSRLPFPSPGDLPNPGIESRSPALQADALTSEPPGKPPVTLIDNFIIHTVYSSQDRILSNIKDRQLSHIFVFACFLYTSGSSNQKHFLQLQRETEVLSIQQSYICMSLSATLHESYMGKNGELLFNMLRLMEL